jgi:hypothetical protein
MPLANKMTPQLHNPVPLTSKNISTAARSIPYAMNVVHHQRDMLTRPPYSQALEQGVSIIIYGR